MARTNAAMPCIMCISTWQWTRKSPRRHRTAALILAVLVVPVAVVPVAVVLVASAADRQQDHGWDFGVDHERFGWPQAASVVGVPGDPEALSVRVEVVPPLAEVEIEHLPADPLTGLRHDGRGVSHKTRPLSAKEASGEVWASLTVCWLVPACVQVTVPPTPIDTSSGKNRDVGLSRIWTVASLPVGFTRTRPSIGCSWHTYS
jgi:hypothetical protein